MSPNRRSAACAPASSEGRRSADETFVPNEVTQDPLTPPSTVPGAGTRPRQRSLVGEALRPYYRWLAIILFAMIVESAMVLAAPWPLKLVIDHGVGPH